MRWQFFKWHIFAGAGAFLAMISASSASAASMQTPKVSNVTITEFGSTVQPVVIDQNSQINIASVIEFAGAGGTADATIIQNGTTNIARVFQIGGTAISTIDQVGLSNTAYVRQIGYSTNSFIAQMGNLNTGTVSQFGWRNWSAIFQFGR